MPTPFSTTIERPYKLSAAPHSSDTALNLCICNQPIFHLQDSVHLTDDESRL